MDNEREPIYLVNFESYLKPKATSKQVQQLAEQKAPQKPSRKPKKFSSKKPPLNNSQLKKSENLCADKPREDASTSSFDMFCESTSIHGFCMLAMTKHTCFLERFTWQIIIFTSVITTALILYKSMIINAATPTVTHIESTHYPAYTVPFPAVTLCSLNRISKEKGLKLAQKFSSTTGLSLSEILRLFQAPYYVSENTHASPEDFAKFDEVLSFNNYSLLQYFMETAPDCMGELVRCMWKGRTAPCDSLFEPILAPRGRCCSFNYYARPVNRSLRQIQAMTPIAPRHITGCGPSSGLTVLIDPRTDDYMAGFLKPPGYRLIIHDAYDFPEDNADNEFIPIKSETYTAVKTEVTYGTKYLRNMGFERRGCTFDPEHNLKYFTEYSFWNCLAECISFKVLAKCGCIPHHMARFGFDMCNLTALNCVAAETEIFHDLVEKTTILGTKICGCMPECSFNHYRGITSSAPLNRTFVKGGSRYFKNITVTDQILLHVFFADLTVHLHRMDALESWQSIVGTVGGITGITMGFSVVSLSEAFFFLCVRPLYLKCVRLMKRVKNN